MSVICSLITDSVSFITGELALKVCVRALRLGIVAGKEVRNAVCAGGECWLAILADCVWTADPDRCRCCAGEVVEVSLALVPALAALLTGPSLMRRG